VARRVKAAHSGSSYSGIPGGVEVALESPAWWGSAKGATEDMTAGPAEEVPSRIFAPWRVDIPLPEGRTAFVLYNFLSPAECAHFMACGESAGLVSVQAEGYPTSMRVVDKATCTSQAVADTLFARAVPFVAAQPPRQGEHEFKPAVAAEWTAAGLNPSFRICRYERGGHFQPHRDGGYQPSEAYRSKLTFMIYLNEAFEGGPTSFYDKRQRTYVDGNPDFAVFAFTPKQGSCLIFDSDAVHDGGKLTAGKKFIMRSEVMFARCPPATTPVAQTTTPVTSGAASFAASAEEQAMPMPAPP